MLLTTPDGSVETRDGRVVLFSVHRFISEIAQGHVCFICGADPTTKQFNNEHVIPDWVLRRYALHSGRVIMPNSAELAYGRYVIPCCVECNAAMSEFLEGPISEAFEGGCKGLELLIKDGGGPRLFVWLASIFLKTHLKDRELRWHLDVRRGEQKIAELYDWTELHHIHCIVRSFYSGARLAQGVYGSLAILPASGGEGPESFDYGDLLPGRSILLRLGDAAVIAVLNDSGAALGVLDQVFKAITGPLTRLQLRELMVRMAYCNMLLEPRPRFQSELDLNTEDYVISAILPHAYSLADDPDSGLFGRLFYFSVGPILEAVKADPQTIAHVKEGRFTFLFDDCGTFLSS